MGWSGVKNGKLISLAIENGFDVFVTADRNLSFQQNINRIPLAVIILEAESTQLRHTLPLMAQVLKHLSTITAGTVIKISSR